VGCYPVQLDNEMSGFDRLGVGFLPKPQFPLMANLLNFESRPQALDMMVGVLKPALYGVHTFSVPISVTAGLVWAGPRGPRNCSEDRHTPKVCQDLNCKKLPHT